MSDKDPLKVEDWSAYEKSMLDVLREEWRARPKIAPVERPMPTEELRQFVQGKPVKLDSDESLVSDAAPQPAVLPMAREQAEKAPPSIEMEDEASSAGPALQSASVVPDSPAQSEQSAAPWWRIPVILSSLAVAVAGGAVALVKPVRDANRAPTPAVSQKPPVQNDANPDVGMKDASAAISAKDAGTVVSTIPAPAIEPGKNEYTVSGGSVHLRGAAGVNAPVLRILRQGTAVTIKERSARNEWCRVETAGGYEGWMKCRFLAQYPTPGTPR